MTPVKLSDHLISTQGHPWERQIIAEVYIHELIWIERTVSGYMMLGEWKDE